MKNLEIIQSKVFTPESLKTHLSIWRFLNKKIVFSNGCFDILHLGHIDYLSKAADEGDILIIGLNSDDSVRRLKGESRPVVAEDPRSIILASLRFVDVVILFDEDTPYELIKFIQPDILVKGSDYTIDEIVGSDIVLKKGGAVKTIEFVEGFSSTDVIKKINNLNRE